MSILLNALISYFWGKSVTLWHLFAYFSLTHFKMGFHNIICSICSSVSAWPYCGCIANWNCKENYFVLIWICFSLFYYNFSNISFLLFHNREELAMKIGLTEARIQVIIIITILFFIRTEIKINWTNINNRNNSKHSE